MFLVSGGLRIAMICMYRKESSGRFSEYEKLIAKKVCAQLASNYKISLDYERHQNDLDVFRKTCNQGPVAMMIVDGMFRIIYRNDLASAYCDDVAEAQSVKTCIITSDAHPSGKIAFVINAVQNAIRCQLPEFELRGQRGLYHFTVTPLHADPDHADQLYSVYINYIDVVSLDSVICKVFDLTSREMEIAQLVMQGLTNNEISETLFISFHTVKTHMTNIFKKTNASNRTEMVSRLQNI
jgi:DNA-binding CsgD family transcriptional regulator